MIAALLKEDSTSSRYCVLSVHCVSLRLVWVYLVVTVMVFTQTLSLHPAVTALLVSSSSISSDWTERYFTPVTCFLVSLYVSLLVWSEVWSQMSQDIKSITLQERGMSQMYLLLLIVKF